MCGRTKGLYSLWDKIETKEVDNLDHIADVKALRVVIEPKKSKRKSVNANGDQEVVVEEENKDCGVWLCYHTMFLALFSICLGFNHIPPRFEMIPSSSHFAQGIISKWDRFTNDKGE